MSEPMDIVYWLDRMNLEILSNDKLGLSKQTFFLSSFLPSFLFLSFFLSFFLSLFLSSLISYLYSIPVFFGSFIIFIYFSSLVLFTSVFILVSLIYFQ